MKIIISVAVAIFLIGCSDESSTSSVKQELSQEPVKKAVVVEEVKKPAIEVAPMAVEIVDEKSKIVLEESTDVVEVATKEAVASKSGAALFKVCSSCHGVNAEKKALNKSQVIQGWPEVQVLTALNGYKDGGYGGTMKGLMKSQVSKLSDADISVLARYISGL